MLPPILFLASVIALCAAGWAGHKLLLRHRRKKLRELADQWEMRYTPNDLFNFTLRLKGNFPIPDATDIRVVDLIYGAEQDAHRYFFTAEYTAGPLDHYRRDCRAMTVCEHKDTSSHAPVTDVTVALAGHGIVEQYRQLHGAAAAR